MTELRPHFVKRLIFFLVKAVLASVVLMFLFMFYFIVIP